MENVVKINVMEKRNENKVDLKLEEKTLHGGKKTKIKTLTDAQKRNPQRREPNPTDDLF